MALTNAHIELTLDRDKMRFSVDDTSTRIFSLDESIDLTVSGWTLEEATETAGKTPYEPFLQILLNGIVLAEVALKGAASPTANASGTYDLTGTLSTNTAQMAMAFAGMSQETMRQFSARIFASTSPNPIADGYIDVWNFPSPCGPAPKELPSASAVLAGIKDDLQEHVEDTDNPHGVTPGQIGAASSGELAAVSGSLSSLTATVGGKQDKLTAGTGISIEGNTISSTGGAGGVSSVNTKTGDVTLSASDVHARPDTWTPTADDVGALAANGKAADAVKADSASSVAWSGVTSKPEWIGSTKPTYTADDVGALSKNGGQLVDSDEATTQLTVYNESDAEVVINGLARASLDVGTNETVNAQLNINGSNPILYVGDVNVMTAIGGKLDSTAQAADSAKLGGTAAADFAKVSNLPYPIAATSGALSDRTVNTTTANSLTLPAAIANKARDLVLVLDLSDEPEAQTISISPATGETIQLLTDATDTFSAEAGKVNILYFTEITSGKFLVTRKAVS